MEVRHRGDPTWAGTARAGPGGADDLPVPTPRRSDTRTTIRRGRGPTPGPPRRGDAVRGEMSGDSAAVRDMCGRGGPRSWAGCCRWSCGDAGPGGQMARSMPDGAWWARADSRSAPPRWMRWPGRGERRAGATPTCQAHGPRREGGRFRRDGCRRRGLGHRPARGSGSPCPRADTRSAPTETWSPSVWAGIAVGQHHGPAGWRGNGCCPDDGIRPVWGDVASTRGGPSVVERSPRSSRSSNIRVTQSGGVVDTDSAPPPGGCGNGGSRLGRCEVKIVRTQRSVTAVPCQLPSQPSPRALSMNERCPMRNTTTAGTVSMTAAAISMGQSVGAS